MQIVALIFGLVGTITGCLALIIQWLAYRRDTKQNKLEASREQQASEPFFKWTGGGSGCASGIKRFDFRREFSNEGGPITEIEITADDNVEAKIRPATYIGEHESGVIDMSKFGITSMPEVRFTISYNTRLRRRSSQSFVWSTSSNTPKRIGNTNAR